MKQELVVNELVAPSPQGGFPSTSETHLLQQLEEELKTRGFSRETLKVYVYHNRAFLSFLQDRLAIPTEEEVTSYLTFLAENHSPSYVSLARAAITFFYRTVLLQDPEQKPLGCAPVLASSARHAA